MQGEGAGRWRRGAPCAAEEATPEGEEEEERLAARCMANKITAVYTFDTLTILQARHLSGRRRRVPRMRGAKVAKPPSRKFRGVYERQPGRWVADFRSHRLNIRRWIGTFPSEAEAKAAYDDFVTRFSLSGYVHVAIVTASPADLSRNGHKIDLVSDESNQSEMRLKQDAGAEAAPCMPSLTSPASPPLPAAVMPHEALPYADERQMGEPFVAEDLASNHLIAAADLANLPLPSLDDKLDFSSGDWSLASSGLQ
ncbi:hypothetical protein VPH35_139994 [Triticum aestivum]